MMEVRTVLFSGAARERYVGVAVTSIGIVSEVQEGSVADGDAKEKEGAQRTSK